jgi:hypothetical protein
MNVGEKRKQQVHLPYRSIRCQVDPLRLRRLVVGGAPEIAAWQSMRSVRPAPFGLARLSLIHRKPVALLDLAQWGA